MAMKELEMQGSFDLNLHGFSFGSSDAASLDSEVDVSSGMLSIPSQPPDIRNWFSSYESPPLDLDDLDNFDVSQAIEGDYKEIYPQDVGEVELKETKKTGKFGNLSNGTNDKEILQTLKLRKCASIVFVSEEILVSPADDLPNKLNGEANRGSAKMVEQSREETLAQCAARSGSGAEKQLKGRASREDTDFISPKGMCEVLPRKPFTSSNIKEKVKVYAKNDGFISTKNKENDRVIGINVSVVRKNMRDLLARKQHKEGSTYGGRHAKVNGKDQVQLHRVALKERPNALVEGGLTENSGKWLCPQKNKPYIEPPLKQLRLERWVHRLH